MACSFAVRPLHDLVPVFLQDLGAGCSRFSAAVFSTACLLGRDFGLSSMGFAVMGQIAFSWWLFGQLLGGLSVLGLVPACIAPAISPIEAFAPSWHSRPEGAGHLPPAFMLASCWHGLHRCGMASPGAAVLALFLNARSAVRPWLLLAEAPDRCCIPFALLVWGASAAGS